MASTLKVQLECNWRRVGGCELSDVVQTRTTCEDIFVRPSLDDIIAEENAVLFAKEGSDEPCEVQICLKTPIYKIDSISMVCTAPKLELFTGPLKEYTETLYGEVAEDDDNDKVFSYRFDIVVEKSGITEAALKLLASSDEICIFGICVQTAPNPNGITTGVEINMQNVQNMLSNTGQKISPHAEKCMLFMQAANQMKRAPVSHHCASALLEQLHQAMAGKNDPTTSKNAPIENTDFAKGSQAELNIAITTHIDNRFEQLERKITKHLDAALAQQNEKLNKILQLLEKINVD